MNRYYKPLLMVQSIMSLYISLSTYVSDFKYLQGDHHGRDRKLVGFTTIYAISDHHH